MNTNKKQARKEDAKFGAKSSFEDILRSYHRRIYNLCFSMLRDRHEAEDVSQDTFLRLFEHISSGRAVKNHGNLAYTIALNKCRNRLRRRKLICFLSFDFLSGGRWHSGMEPPSSPSRPDLELQKNEVHRYLSDCVNSLPQYLKEAFLLHLNQRLPRERIAEILGITLNNARVRISRAEKILWEKYLRYKS